MRHMFVMAVVWCMAVLPMAPVEAGAVYWEDGDGGSGTIAGATWNDIQTAINSAQGNAATPGAVKLSGDYQRTSTNDTTLTISTGNIGVSGGWDSTFTTQSGKSTLDVNARNDGLNDAKRVMHVTGAPDVGLSDLVLTKGSGNDNGGGLRLDGASHRFTMEHVRVTANEAAHDFTTAGGGIYIAGDSSDRMQDLRITSCEIDHNYSASAGYGGGMYVQYAGTADHPAIVENTEISYNRVHPKYNKHSEGGGIYVNEENRMLLANCRLTNNQGNTGSAIRFGGWQNKPEVVVFGSLVTGNEGYGGGAAPTVYGQAWVGSAFVTLANTTIADNDGGQVYTSVQKYGASVQRPIQLVNSIYSDDDAGLHVYYNRKPAHLDMQASTLEAAWYKYRDPDGNTYTVTGLLNALGTQDTSGDYRFHSIDAAGNITQNLEQNIESAPGFLGSGDDPYQLDPANPFSASSADNAELAVGAFSYVDVNYNQAYDPLLDVIVDGTPPAGNHFVYLTDLLGQDRVLGGGLDRGAYEMEVPPIPEPAGLSLVGLALLALKRRKRS